ncbi:MAG: hypothetical protein Q4Q53_07275 [Methanocorpusculum sp.]|nr:hypothetical protein [Methanocorpusculum sp.]
MDSYEVRKESERCFTVTVTSPKNLEWKPLDSSGINIVNKNCTTNSNGKNYSWTLEVDEPGLYELRMIHQSFDGVFKKIVIPIIADSALTRNTV